MSTHDSEAAVADAREALAAADRALSVAKARLAGQPSDPKLLDAAELAERQHRRCTIALEGHLAHCERARSDQAERERDAAQTRIAELQARADRRALLARIRDDIGTLAGLEAEAETIIGRLVAAAGEQQRDCHEIEALAGAAEVAIGSVRAAPLLVAELRMLVGVAIEHARARRRALAPEKVGPPATWLHPLSEPPDGARREEWLRAIRLLGIDQAELSGPRLAHAQRRFAWPYLSDPWGARGAL